MSNKSFKSLSEVQNFVEIAWSKIPIETLENTIIIYKMALYRIFTGTAVSAKIRKHAVFLKPTLPGKN